MRCSVIVIAFALLGLGATAHAGPTFVCKGERIEKSSSTWGYARKAGSDYRIEKGSSSIGWARSRSGVWAVETFGGSTLGWLRSSRIEKPNGSTWAPLSDAEKLADCPAPVAAALWVLAQSGRL